LPGALRFRAASCFASARLAEPGRLLDAMPGS
jgi:hypothetical protein